MQFESLLLLKCILQGIHFWCCGTIPETPNSIPDINAVVTLGTLIETQPADQFLLLKFRYFRYSTHSALITTLLQNNPRCFPLAIFIQNQDQLALYSIFLHAKEYVRMFILSCSAFVWKHYSSQFIYPGTGVEQNIRNTNTTLYINIKDVMRNRTTVCF